MNAPNKKITPSVEDELAAMDKAAAERVRIWNALGKTDPAHTKPFSRAGGFKGTAIKPIWVVKRLTEQFGACGEGWGIGEPKFETININGDVLVYCTVSCWHTNPENTLYGVGGDKVAGKNKNGPYTDDEAFKKSFTDAVNNAFKFVGVAADIHMGQFDDSKYVNDLRKEFEAAGNVNTDKPDPKPLAKEREGDMSPTALRGSIKTLIHNINGCGTTEDLEDLLQSDDAVDVIEQCTRRFPAWWATGEGCPAEFTPLKTLIAQTREGLANLEKEPA